MYQKKTCLFLAFLTCLITLNAQQTTSNAGLNIIGGNGNMSFVVGQVNYVNIIKAGSISEGILQVFNRHYARLTQ